MFIWKDTAKQAHVESIGTLEVTKDFNQKALFEATPKLARYWKSWSQNNFDRYGIEIMIDSMKKDGTQSLMVISRGVDKYVTELAVDHTKSVRCDEASSSTGKLVAKKKKGQYSLKRLHLRHQPCRSNNEIGRIYHPFQGLMMTIAAIFRIR